MIISLDKIVKKYTLKITGVLHIGAHFGEEYLAYREQGIRNMIFFEPVKSNFTQLSKSLGSEDDVVLVNLALGNFTGEKEMWIETVNQGQSCSLLEPGLHLSQYPRIVFNTKEIVKVDRLDNVPFDRQKYNMVNIDVQGYELEVFKGAIETLKTIDIIYTEVNVDKVYKDCCLVGDLDEFLGERGFVRILTNIKPKTWGDALYLKYN